MVVCRYFKKSEHYDADSVGELVAFHEFCWAFALRAEKRGKLLNNSITDTEHFYSALEKCRQALEPRDTLSECAEKYAAVLCDVYGGDWAVIARHGYGIAADIYEHYDTEPCTL